MKTRLVGMESVVFKNCTKCKKSHPITFFFKQSKASDGLNTWCKKCITDGMRESARRRKREVVELLGGKCNHCNGVFPACVYDMHHKDPLAKEGGIAQMLQKYSIEHPVMQAELQKCILLCSNCHRIEHSKQ